MPNCSNCGEMVTPAFARVFADNDGTVHGCVHCRTSTELMDGTDGHGGTSAEAVSLGPP